MRMTSMCAGRNAGCATASSLASRGVAMILSDLLGTEVREADGTAVGRVIDARFRLEGNTNPSQARLVGLIVSRGTVASYHGYEPTSSTRHVHISNLLRASHRCC